MKVKIVGYLFLGLMIASCSDSSNEKVLDVKPEQVKIERLEQKLTSFSSTTEVVEFLKEYEKFSKLFLGTDQFPSIDFLTEKMLLMAQDSNMDTLRMGAESVFKDLSSLQGTLGSAYGYVKHYYPEFKVPEVYTIVSGFGTDMFLKDGIVVIGLDYFSTGQAKYYPKDIPGYVLKYYNEEYIPTKVMALTSQAYNEPTLTDNSLISEMVFYGKAYYFIEHMLPEAADSMVIEYSSTEIDDLMYMAPKVWAHFVENKLFFETSRDAIRRYIDERPNTVEIGNKCPGRIGRWLGWQIVRAYMENNEDVTLQELMSEKDASKIFRKSKYKPKLKS